MKRLLFILTTGIFLCTASNSFAYWIWTPKTGKFINPKTAVKPTPKEQFDFAKSFFDAKKYKEASQEFKKLINTYPKSFEASESQYYLGRIFEEDGSLYEAYRAYQKVIDIYPFSERIAEIIEREYKIGEEFMTGQKRKAMGVPLPVDNPAIEIFKKVVDNSTYGPYASKAQYKLGLVLKSLGRFYEAEDAFNKIISSYPDSEWSAAAKYQVALCKANMAKGSDYEQESTKEAKEKFEEIVREHPDAVLSREAEKNIEQLREKEAESNYTIARFYEKQKDYTAAKVYYEDIVSQYSGTSWGGKAAERLKALERKK